MHDPGDPHSLPGNEVRCVYKDLNNNIWVGTNKGLALFNPESENFIQFNSDGNLSHYIYDIKQLDGNKLWIAMEFGGIAIMDLSQRLFLLPEQTQFHYIREGDDGYSLSNSSTRCIFQDSFKNIWTGVWGGGINFLSYEPPLFSGYYYSPNQNSMSRLNNKTASSVCVDSQGKLWIGTDGGGINVFDQGKRVSVYQEEIEDMSGNSVLASLRDSEDNLWFGLFMGGVNYYDAKRKIFHRNFLKELEYEDIRSFYEDDRHILWIGTSRGIYKVSLADKKIVGHYEFENNLVRCVMKDSQGRLWIGSFGSGLGIGDDELQDIKLFNMENLFPSNTINAIYEDSRKNVWVGTGEGLVCFSSPSDWEYKVYRREEGLTNTHIRAITEDANHNIWVSTNKGISCLLRDKDVFYNYDHWDNVPMGNFMSGSVAKDQNGEIYFGSINGLCRFNPDFVLAKRESPAAVITEMKIFAPLGNAGDNEEVVSIDGRSKVRLKYMQNSFNITFNIRNYALVNQVEYAYMLIGLEDAWYTVTDPNNVTFRNVPPGDYHFMVKTRIKNQEWSDEVTTLDVHIVPPLWLTWWAKCSYVLLSGAILFFILYAYKKKLDVEVLYDLEKKNHEQEQELNQERLRFYTNITHELRTPLTLILGPLEDLINDEKIPPFYGNKIKVIHGSALRLLNLINQILEFRKTETQNRKLTVAKGDLHNVVTEIGLRYKELNRNEKVKFHINIDSKGEKLYFDVDVITTIMNNLLSNAVKYTPEGEINLSMRPVTEGDNLYTEILVSDTGYGISPDALPHIFDRYYQAKGKHQASGTGIGLALVKSLADLHEGSLHVESETGKGTTFTFRILTENTYPDALHKEEKTESIPEKPESLKEEENDTCPVILVVEDNDDIREYIATSFSNNYHILTATNGKEGIEQALKYIPDIIISDIMMPVMDGIELCKLIKEDIRTSHIPVILLTAKDSIQDKEEGYESGADSYLTKPFSAKLLHSRVHNLLESRKKLALLITNRTKELKPEQSQESMQLSKLDEEFLNRFTAIVEENIDTPQLDMPFMIGKMNMSHSTLYRKIKGLTGISGNEFIRKIRLKNSLRLLMEEGLNISEAAYASGFNDLGYFRACFKEEYGMAPSEYIKQKQ